MRPIAWVFAFAALVLLGAAAAPAAPLDRPPFEPPVGPIEPGVLDPVDSCLLFPQLCGPERPPQDPCLAFPSLCEPPDPCELDPSLCEPPDPCEVMPFLCEPPDVCELEPSLCACDLGPALCEDPPVTGDPPVTEEPPVAEAPDAPAGPVAGSAIVRAAGARVVEGLAVRISADTTALTFSMMTEDGTLLTGNLTPKGKKGRKFKMFLDAGSTASFEAFVAARGAAAAGRPAGAVIGGTTKLVLKIDTSGVRSLKVKSEVLSSGLGEVVYKANLVASTAP